MIVLSDPLLERDICIFYPPALNLELSALGGYGWPSQTMNGPSDALETGFVVFVALEYAGR